MPVITPPAAGIEEQSSKNWYRAEALRKIIYDLNAVWQEVDQEAASQYIEGAIQNLELARRQLDPRLNKARAKLAE